MSNATHDSAREQSPERVNDGRQIFTIPRPTWADETVVGQDLNGAVVMHMWTAPTVAMGGIFDGEVGGELEVKLQQIDDLGVRENAVTYEAGRPMIFLTEADLELSEEEARRYAAAIVEACDRLGGQA